MIASTTVCKTANGAASAWRPERHLSSSHLNQHRGVEVSVQETSDAFGCAATLIEPVMASFRTLAWLPFVEFSGAGSLYSG